MTTIDSATAVIADLPEVTESVRYGNPAWSVGKNVFAWIRPFSKADLKRFGSETPPSGPILAVRTADLHEKEAILAAHPRACFTISHFDGFAAVLVDLDNTDDDELRELIIDGWLVHAPKNVAETFLAGN
ncbi:MmcQ/YjbR family DNA-binding protein [Rhodococcus sp. ARC_M12]|uniref:MmcQ/YjbR family DNA-binding protein n=1 Tax=Rhodococcus sp. ARC_M12 TaxID=2928854 RepID=UPI001FB1EABF|nr:MmcQ/YjbR family DNA-binding protein [Rhodococcus sp. ARC_M12]MCJ0976206.1 MmcQ/YjbR family DNA-binding protein [Rhodococcus sp. ARC_M12]